MSGELFEEMGANPHNAYRLRALERFARFFGLASLSREEQGKLDRQMLVQKTRLLDQLVTFVVDAYSGPT